MATNDAAVNRARLGGEVDTPRWTDPAEWRQFDGVTDATPDGALQMRVKLYESRRGLLKIRGVAEFWVRGTVDYTRIPGSLSFQVGLDALVERLVAERMKATLR